MKIIDTLWVIQREDGTIVGSEIGRNTPFCHESKRDAMLHIARIHRDHDRDEIGPHKPVLAHLVIELEETNVKI